MIKQNSHNTIQPDFKVRLYLLLFLIVILRATTVSAGIDSAVSEYRTFNIFSTDDFNRWSVSESVTKSTVSQNIFGLHFQLKLAYSLPEGDLRWGKSDITYRNKSYFSGKIHLKDESFKTAFTLSPENKSVSISFGWQNKQNYPDDYYTSLCWQPNGFFKGSIKFSKNNPLPHYSELIYHYNKSDGVEQEGGIFYWEAPASVSEFKFQIKPFNNFQINTKLTEAHFKPIEPNSTPAYQNQLFLNGLFYDRSWAFEYNSNTDFTTSLAYRKIKLNSRLRGNYNNEEFAYFGIVNGDFDQWELQTKRNHLEISFAKGHAEGDIQGTIKAKPFLDGLLILLGERRHFIADISLNWKQIQAKDRIFCYKKIELSTALTYLRISPELKQINWRPKLMGFGIDDVKRYQLDVERAELINLHLNPSFKWHYLLFDLNISQWLPIKIKKSESSSTTSNNDTSQGTTNSEETENITSGGLNISFSICKTF